MIGTTGGAVLVVVNILFAAALGIVAGGLACLGFRQSWGLKVGLLDGILAAFVAVVAAYVVAMIEASRGVWGFPGSDLGFSYRSGQCCAETFSPICTSPRALAAQRLIRACESLANRCCIAREKG